jgi:hypothetical protein
LTVSLAVHLIARSIFASAQVSTSIRWVFARFWPIVLLSLFIIGGAQWGIKFDHIHSHFMSFGLSMLYLPALAVAVDSSSNKLAFMQRLGMVYVATAMTMLIEMPFNRTSTHHEEIFLAAPLGLYFLSAVNWNIAKVLAGAVLVVACGLSVKNTTYIMMAMTLLIAASLWVRRMTRIQDGLKAAVFIFLAFLLVVGLLAGGAFAWYKLSHLLPHGNTEYRLEMYRIAWSKFLHSPLWGTGFAGEAVSYFGLYNVGMGTQFLPTHSDILDILANGGLIGAVLWLLTVLNIPVFFMAAWRRLAQKDQVRNEAGWRCVLVLATYQMGAVITYAVNPPLINPVHGVWIWGGMAVTAVLWRYMLEQDRKPMVPSIKRRG